MHCKSRSIATGKRIERKEVAHRKRLQVIAN